MQLQGPSVAEEATVWILEVWRFDQNFTWISSYGIRCLPNKNVWCLVALLFFSYVTMIHGILCQKKTWRSYSWFNPLLNRRNRCVFPPLGLAQAKIMRKIMTMKNMSQHGDSTDDLNCLKCSKMSSRKIPQAGRTSDPKSSKMHTSSEHYASKTWKIWPSPVNHFFSSLGSASQNQWFASGNVPHAFRDFLRQFLASQAETPERPERWISKGLKKEKVTYPIDTISLYIFVYLSEHI